jgi:8-oxo-dGTP pyrophosphatase MutT (NUDIX family)
MRIPENGERPAAASPAENLPAFGERRVTFPSWSSLPENGMGRSAVLVPLFRSEGAFLILFLRRSPHLTRHGGEICFPGGMRDDSDESPLMTALRETEEETGIPPAAVKPLLLLPSELTVVSSVEVFPVLGIVSGIDPEKDLVLPPSEIAAACTADMAAFPERPRRKEFLIDGHVRSYPEYDLPDGSVVWGVTARILEKVLAFRKKGEEEWRK